MSKANETNAALREGQVNQTNAPAEGIGKPDITAAMAETLQLYHAWLGYLLTLRGSDTLRVKAEDIRRALDQLSCSVTREGDEYVICLGGGETAHESD